MDLRERAESAAAGVYETLSASPTGDQAKRVTELIEKMVIDAVIEEGKRCAQVARDSCASDREMARKVARDVRISNEALIANLSSMR